MNEHSIPHSRVDGEIIDRTVELLTQEKVVGWFQGRMEFGPRALGGRSILADARDPEMRNIVNRRIKFREGFRPFAPTVTLEGCPEWFELDQPSPYMLLVADVREGKRVIPSVTHVDNSARIQTVNRHANPRFHRLLQAFKEMTGCAVLVNTSFNVRDEPIVCTPEDAFKCFMATEMDVLVLGNFVLLKDKQ